MKLKEIIEMSGKDRKQICEEAGIKYSSLSDLINERNSVFKLNISDFYKLAGALSLSVDKLYRMLQKNYPYFFYPVLEDVFVEEQNVTGKICLYEDACYVSFSYQGEEFNGMYVCKLTEKTYPGYRDLVEFTILDKIDEILLERSEFPCSIH